MHTGTSPPAEAQTLRDLGLPLRSMSRQQDEDRVPLFRGQSGTYTNGPIQLRVPFVWWDT